MKKVSIISFLCIVAVTVWAIPARRNGVVKVQPDGSELTVYQHGDEYFHWQTNEKGEWLELGEDGFYRVVEALSAEHIEVKRMTSPGRVSHVATPLNVVPRGLVILVNFKDVKFKTSKAEIDSMLNGQNYSRNYSYTYDNKKYSISSKGSARQYFYDSSNGLYDPVFDVVGPVTISKEMAYYGETKGNFDAAPWDMVSEACELADRLYNVDFTRYNNDKDNYVDFVYVIYAGYSEADGAPSNTIWPHAYSLFEAGVTCRVDDQLIDVYACSNEIDYFSEHHAGIGAFCHEFSHVLGLPDLYVTNGGSYKTLGDWDIMDHGPYNNECNTPPVFSAYERFFLGWLKPRLITEPENIKLQDLKKINEALLISATDKHNLVGNDPSPKTFYILENRQQEGWDTYLPGHGMMLTKIQYNYDNWSVKKVNDSSPTMGVNLIEADGVAPKKKDEGYYGKPGDLFPTGANSYSKIADHMIENIEEKNGVIYFAYKGGTDETAVENIENQADVLAIYNILGQKQATTNIEDLSRGTYVIVTTAGNKKIVR